MILDEKRIESQERRPFRSVREWGLDEKRIKKRVGMTPLKEVIKGKAR